MRNEKESGIVLVAVVIMLLPVVITVGAFTSSMTSRTERLGDEVLQEKALMAAESGVDLAIWVGSIGKLRDGEIFSYELSADTTCVITPTHLLVDGRDNDGDGDVDEADEDVFQIVSEGRYRDTSRNVAAYLGPLPRVPLSFPAAVTVLNPDVDIDLRGTPYMIGYDTNLDGTRGDPLNDAAGMAMASPGTLTDLTDELDAAEATQVIGAGGIPSLATTGPVDVDRIASFVQNSAELVMTNRRYQTLDFGSGLRGDATIAYRDGDVKFTGNGHGAGIMVITGNLEVAGTFRFDGILIVLGDITIGAGTAQIYGALVQGSGGTKVHTRGTFDVRYSSEAIALANSLGGRYVAFNGWQELAR